MPRIRTLVMPLTLVAISLFTLALPVRAQDSPVAVIVNKVNPIDNLPLLELRRMFVGERKFWAGKLTVMPLMRASGAPERDVALRALLQMTDQEYKRHWVEKVFRGEASSAPAELFSNGMAQDAVSNIPGAVALVALKDVRPTVKVLKIDGRLPSDAGYPLH